MTALIKINDAAKKYKISKRSLRYYEEIGLIDSSRLGASQSRYYDSNAVNKIEQIILLRSVKFSINQISQVLLSNNSDVAFDIFENRLAELDEKISELSYSRSVINSFVKIGKSIGTSNINIYQLLKDQIYTHNNNERMIDMEKRYDGYIIKFEFGVGVTSLISPKENDNFLEKIKDIRHKLESQTGKEIPLIRICDNNELDDLEYRISVKGKIMIDNNLGAVPMEERVQQMLSNLDFIIKSNIDVIS